MEKSFNPLNQVFVFNGKPYSSLMSDCRRSGFNPLNQVFVFNGNQFSLSSLQKAYQF